MFDRSPEVHSHCANLNFGLKAFGAIDRIYSIINDQMITPVTTLLDMFQIVFFTFDGHITAATDNRGYGINIFFKLTDDADTGNVFDLFFHLFHGNMFALHFFQDTWKTLDTSTDLFNRRIQVILLVFIYNMFKLYHQFFDSKFIWT